MRYTTCLLLGALMAAVVVTDGFAEETKSPWWHFGMDKDKPSAPATVTAAPTMRPATPVAKPAADDSWVKWPSMPKMSWPETGSKEKTATAPSAMSTARVQSLPPRTNYGKPTHVSRPKNTWAQQPASATTKAPGSSTWHSVTESTKSAWHKTVDYVTPGESKKTTAVASNSKSSWWGRMWGSDDKKKEGPQTVTEWMAQDRLDP